MTFKFNSTVVTTLSTFVLTTGIGLLSSSANAFTFTLNQSSGTWSNVEGGSTVQFQTIGNENQIRWGIPADSTSGQSGLGFAGAVGSTRQLGEPFLLGTLRHINNPIYGGTAAEFVDLTINLDLTINPNSSQSNHLAKSFAFTLGVDETPNLGQPRSALQPWIVGETCKYPGITSCPDRIFPTRLIPQDSVQIEGTNYTLEWIGFSNISNRPLIIPGLTEEGNANGADLYVFGRLIEVENQSPIIFPGENLTVNEGDWFNFGSANDGIGDTRNFAWDLDNDGYYDDFTGPTGTWSFADNSTNNIGLRVSYNDGINNSIWDYNALVNVNNVAPTLTNFDLSNPTILEGESVSVLLTATDPGADPISFLLNNNLIGTDNNISGTRQASLDLGIFADNGTFTYTGEAEDKDGGRSGAVGKTLAVLNVAPTLTNFDLSNPTILEGESVSVLLTATDPGADPISFLLNNNLIGTDNNISGTRQASLDLGIFADNGTFTYTGEAEDKDGGRSGAVGKTLTVLNVAPTINSLTQNLLVKEGELFNFAATAFDPGINDILLYGWDFNYDNLYDDFIGNSGQWSFANNSLNTIGLRVSDGDGGFDFGQFNVTVENVAPTIINLTDNLTVWQNELFDFAATAFDPGINDILSYGWDFNNDGVYDDFTGNSGQWFFANPGTYKVALRVSDGDGGFVERSFNVESKQVPEPSSPLGILVFGACGACWLRQRKKQ